MAMTLHSPSKANSRSYLENSVTLFQRTATERGWVEAFEKLGFSRSWRRQISDVRANLTAIF